MRKQDCVSGKYRENLNQYYPVSSNIVLLRNETFLRMFENKLYISSYVLFNFTSTNVVNKIKAI